MVFAPMGSLDTRLVPGQVWVIFALEGSSAIGVKRTNRAPSPRPNGARFHRLAFASSPLKP